MYVKMINQLNNAILISIENINLQTLNNFNNYAIAFIFQIQILLHTLLIKMARGRRGRGRGGGGGPDHDVLYDTFYSSLCSLPQGIAGNSMIFYGSESALITRLKNLTPAEYQQIQECNISLFGTKIQSFNSVVSCCIILWASLLIFPLFFLCCEWYKRLTQPGFSVNIQAYEALRSLFANAPNLKIVNLVVYDNNFSKEKYNLLGDMISMSRLKGFTLRNAVLPFGLVGDQYDDFKENGEKIRDRVRQNGITFQAHWYTTAVL